MECFKELNCRISKAEQPYQKKAWGFLLSFPLTFFFTLTYNLSIPPLAKAFVLINGPKEARLPVDEENPTAVFIWDGSLPEFADKDTFLDGAWADRTDEEVFEGILSLSFSFWNEVPGSFLELGTGPVNENLGEDPEDGINLIRVETVESATASAYAVPTISGKFISDCDITIGNSGHAIASLVATLTHELGHCLGLGHPHTSYNSIMSYSNTRTTVELSADDMAGVIYLYPSSDYKGTDLEKLSCGSLPAYLHASNSRLFSTLLIMFILLVFPLFTQAVWITKKQRLDNGSSH